MALSNFTANLMLLRKANVTFIMNGCPRCCLLKEMYVLKEYQISTFHLYSICRTVVCLQMAAKMGGDQPNMNSSSPVMDPSLYGFGGQKRSLDNGGKPSLHTQHGSAGCSYISALQPVCLKLLPAEHVDSFIIIPSHFRTKMWPSSVCPNCVCLCLFMSDFARPIL